VNWLAMAIVTIFVIYGGVLLILGFQNEENAKKGRRVITFALTGLIIVLAARFIILGAGALFSNSGNETQFQNLPVDITPSP
jgi:uncharacterized membrane protein YphA (DoxX/SURF4 family)